jgi:hypothetical protein
MSHEIAKLLLEKAGTFLQRTQAVQTALSLGMPLREIEQYLDWLDNVRRLRLLPDGKADVKQPHHHISRGSHEGQAKPTHDSSE